MQPKKLTTLVAVVTLLYCTPTMSTQAQLPVTQFVMADTTEADPNQGRFSACTWKIHNDTERVLRIDVARIEGVNKAMVFPLTGVMAFVAPHDDLTLWLPLGTYQLLVWDKREGLSAYTVYALQFGSILRTVIRTAQVNSEPALPQSGDDVLTTATVSSAIDRISRRAHQHLPDSQVASTAQGQSGGWNIENSTAYSLHIYMSGPVSRDINIPAGQARVIDLPQGSYRIAAEVSAPGVIPFFGQKILQPNTRWSSRFLVH